MNHIKGFFTFIADIVRDRRSLLGLAKNDLKAKFASSFLGGIWAYIQPLVTLLVFWFVFEAGFRNPPVNNVPYIIWLAPAYLVWMFYSETLVSGTNSLMEYSYLVKKVNFRVSMIPMVKIISSSFVHIGFIAFIFFMLVVCQVSITIYAVQVVYYFISTCFLLLGMCWLFAAVAPFVKDIVNLVNVFMQIGFWATPIFWSSEGMESWVETILQINPMFYICQGYRDCFIDHVWFWERGGINFYFWGISVLCFVAGAYLFRKLRPQFADVL